MISDERGDLAEAVIAAREEKVGGLVRKRDGVHIVCVGFHFQHLGGVQEDRRRALQFFSLEATGTPWFGYKKVLL